jgi:hypothetical protein
MKRVTREQYRRGVDTEGIHGSFNGVMVGCGSAQKAAFGALSSHAF